MWPARAYCSLHHSPATHIASPLRAPALDASQATRGSPDSAERHRQEVRQCTGAKERTDRAPGRLDGALCGFAQQVLEIGEDLLNGVEIRAVRREEEEPCAGGSAEIVEDYDIPKLRSCDQYFFDIKTEALTCAPRSHTRPRAYVRREASVSELQDAETCASCASSAHRSPPKTGVTRPGA
jgi:hypothetical protein